MAGRNCALGALDRKTDRERGREGGGERSKTRKTRDDKTRGVIITFSISVCGGVPSPPPAAAAYVTLACANEKQTKMKVK